MQFEAADCAVLVTEISDSPVRQWPTLANEDIIRANWWPSFEPSLNGTPCWERQWHGTLFVSLAVAEDDAPAPLTEHQVIEFEADEVRDSTAGEKKKVEDGSRAGVLPKFDFPE
jgi:hypothetical protein